jgi:hypothetical protein
MTDAVGKVGRKCPIRNNRIEKACYSNQRCASVGFFESKLRRDTLKIFFPTASTQSRQIAREFSP